MAVLIPQSIRGRLVVTFTLLFACVAAPLTIYIVTEAQEAAEQQAAEDVKLLASTVAAVLASTGASTDQSAILATIQTASAATEYTAFVIDDSGQIVISTADAAELRPGERPAVDLSAGSAVDEPLGQHNGNQMRAIASIPDGRGSYLVFEGAASALDSSNSELWQRAIVSLVAALAIVGGLTWAVSGRISAPLEHLRRQAAAVSAGDLSVSVDPEGPRDIRDLTYAFNSMTERIRTLITESNDARQRLEMIFENLNEGVIVVNASEEVVAENRRAREILGPEVQSPAGTPFVLVVRDHDLIDHLRTTMREGVGSTIPIDYARSGRAIEATVIPAVGEREQLGIVVLRDVTEIKRLETVRREFVANVSHELRTPLASIRALADTLESGALDDPEVSIDFVQRIVKEVDRLTVLVDELLDLARLESGRLVLRRQLITPSELVISGVERLKPQIERAGLSLSIDIPPELPDVFADRARIEQVLLNLIHNAIKFTPAGGGISITAKQAGSLIRVNVADTGQGIPESELPRVFERFYKADRSRRSEGTGLGLAISKHIILTHQGQIWVESNLGQGSTFSFTLPVATKSAIRGGVSQGSSAQRLAATRD